MDKSSTLDCYLYYMWNTWSYEECIIIFGEMIGSHIWVKWIRECQDFGAKGAPASFYAELDRGTRKKIVQRAIAHYNPIKPC